VNHNDSSCDYFNEVLRTYETGLEMLMALLANGCYWGSSSQSLLWLRAVARMVDLSPVRPGASNPVYRALRRYPACILLYAAGVACVASRNFATLKILMKDPRTSIDAPIEGNKDSPLTSKLVAPYILSEDALNRCSNPEGLRYRTSVRLHGLLRETLRALIPNDSDYDDAFDRFEYLFALVYIELKPGVGAPIGRFGLKFSRLFGASSSNVGEILLNEQEAQGQDWGPLKSGFFKSAADFVAAEQNFREFVLAQASSF
jgi:hypothetical protein